MLEVPSSGFVIELFGLSQDDYDQERFRRRVRVLLLGRQAFLPTAEDVVVTKLLWALGRKHSKDREDARDVIAVQGDRLDWRYIYSWADRHGTRELIDEIRSQIPRDNSIVRQISGCKTLFCQMLRSPAIAIGWTARLE